MFQGRATALRLAAMRKHARMAGAGYPEDYANVIRLLVEAGADVEAATPNGSALMVAAANFVPSVRALLAVGANVNAVNEVKCIARPSAQVCVHVTFE
jgi:hypothetical protein